MIAYKFLAAGRVAPFSGRAWPEADWLETEGPLAACRNGVHACRIEDLPYWLGPELWEVELEGEIVAGELKLVAGRGRLVRRVDAWDDAVRAEFAAACVRRVALHAANELRDAGLSEDGDALGGAEDLDRIAESAAAAARAAREAGARAAERLAEYASDAVEWATAYPPSGVAYVAAHAADARSRSDYADPFAAERTEQARWLAARLGLSPGPA